MKKYLIVSALLLSLTLPSFADTAVQSLLVRRQGDNVNIRVTVTNPGAATQEGPIRVTLFARQDNSKEWAEITSWDNIAKIPKGHRVSRDYFDENNTVLKELAGHGNFEVRAVVQAPGDVPPAEEISVFHPDQD